MSARREPSAPPVIPGHTHRGLLGMGGFADVFLYEQHMPRREVAVKVLLAGSLGDEVRERFRLEADLMARLSHHPSIVTVHFADVAADGRPYLVMEHCSRAGLGARYRSERMSVGEVLRIGVRLASAVESAHRAGVLHRDIKPANVLVTDFGWPALTDFGIAATTSWSTGSAVGMSIPWAPPELLAEDPRGDERSDVYSLAATIYSLLARRSPFEVPGAGNTAADLIARIERLPLGPTGRGDVPDSLQAVLSRAMAKDPQHRHPTALALARALQQVEAELMLPVTALDLPEDPAAATDGRAGTSADLEASQATRVRPVRSVPAEQAPVAGVLAPVAPADARQAGAAGGELPDDVPEAWRRDVAALPDGGAVPDGAPAGRTRRRWVRALTGTAAGVLVVGALVMAAALGFGSGAPVATPEQPAEQPTEAAVAARPLASVRAVPAPVGLEGVLDTDGTAVFTWDNPAPSDGDQYLWGVVVPGTSTVLEVVAEPTVAVAPGDPSGQVCIEVSILRSDGRYSTTPAVGCAGRAAVER